MATLGMIVRADQGGLGNQTWEFWRHLKPEITVVMCMHEHARGHEVPTRYEQGGWDGIVFYNHGTRLADNILMQALADVDVLFSVEGWYNDSAVPAASRQGVRTVLVANPELFDHQLPRPDCVILPTTWEAQRMPFAQVLPQPVALDRFVGRQQLRSECVTLFHPSAPAMLDRNGTEDLLNALPHVRNPLMLELRTARRNGVATIGNVRINWGGHRSEHYWASYPETADVMVLPRRYGGLCLPAMEAAALGIPVVTLDTPPHNEWEFAHHTPARQSFGYSMKGGEFPVYQASSSRHLAKAIDRLVDDTSLLQELSQAALDYADTVSWERLLPEWEAVARG